MSEHNDDGCRRSVEGDCHGSPQLMQQIFERRLSQNYAVDAANLWKEIVMGICSGVQ